MPWPKTSPRSRGYGHEWTKLRKQILERDAYLCQVCAKTGRITSATSVHHVVSKAAHGIDDPSNLISICEEHHTAATAEEQGQRVVKRPRRIALDGTITE